MKYAVVTLGCRVNQADSLRLEGALRRRGAESTAVEVADLVVVNTCTVTAAADQSARQTIRRIARCNPTARIVVTGCYATRRPADLAGLPRVVDVVPNDRKPGLVVRRVPGAAVPGSVPDSPTDSAIQNPAPGTSNPAPRPWTSLITPGVAGRTAYTLCVQTGCDERCAYCIVPLTRGRPRSVPLPHVLHEAGQAVRAGFKEIVVTGVHLGSWGRDLVPRRTLLDLLCALAAADLGVLFRISAIEPMDCSPALVDLVARAGCFAPHLHLPLQHASDRILGLMQRPYTLDAYRRIVDLVRRRLPHAAIGADLIVGFPGETDQDFAQNEEYLASSPLTALHVFPYSDRPGTAAARLPGRVPGAVVRARAHRLRAIGASLAERFRRAQLDHVRVGLTLEDGSLVLTDNYLKVRIGPGLPRNTRVDVLIEEVGADLRGRVVRRA